MGHVPGTADQWPSNPNFRLFSIFLLLATDYTDNFRIFLLIWVKIYIREILYKHRAAYHHKGAVKWSKGGPDCNLSIYLIYKAIFLNKAVEIIQKYEAEFFSIQYWPNDATQPGQKSGPDWFYAVISNISL